MGGTVEIRATIMRANDLASLVHQVTARPLPDVDDELKTKERWIQATIKNATQFEVALGGSPYFEYGRYWNAPSSFGGFNLCTFSVCNVDGYHDGVIAGQPFRIYLDSAHYFDFTLGLSNPASGAYKAGVAQSSKPHDGIDSATAEGNTIVSDDTFEGEDMDCRPAKFKLYVSAAPGQEAVFVINQVLE